MFPRPLSITEISERSTRRGGVLFSVNVESPVESHNVEQLAEFDKTVLTAHTSGNPRVVARGSLSGVGQREPLFEGREKNRELLGDSHAGSCCVPGFSGTGSLLSVDVLQHVLDGFELAFVVLGGILDFFTGIGL